MVQAKHTLGCGTTRGELQGIDKHANHGVPSSTPSPSGLRTKLRNQARTLLQEQAPPAPAPLSENPEVSRREYTSKTDQSLDAQPGLHRSPRNLLAFCGSTRGLWIDPFGGFWKQLRFTFWLRVLATTGSIDLVSRARFTPKVWPQRWERSWTPFLPESPFDVY